MVLWGIEVSGVGYGGLGCGVWGIGCMRMQVSLAVAWGFGCQGRWVWGLECLSRGVVLFQGVCVCVCFIK